MPSHASLVKVAEEMANQDYGQYTKAFRIPPTSLMIKTGLWIELEAMIGFIMGLGLASLMGQRTVPVVILIVFTLLFTPLLVHQVLKHFINAQRLIVGAAMARIEPRQLYARLWRSNGPFQHTTIPISVTAAVLCHRRLDRRMDRARGLADGDPRRLSDAIVAECAAESRADHGPDPAPR